MSKFRDFLRRLLPTRIHGNDSPRRVLVSVDISAVARTPEGGQAFALGLHDALVRNGRGCAIVDADEWVLDKALEAGHLAPEACDGQTDGLTGRPRWERRAKDAVGWLMANRLALLKSAFAAGGDAEVVIVLHQTDFLSLMVSIDQRSGDSWWMVSIHPAEPGREGFVASAPGKDFGPPFAFGHNGLDDLRAWERLASRLLDRA